MFARNMLTYLRMVVAVRKKDGVENHYLWRSFAHEQNQPLHGEVTGEKKYRVLNPGPACREPIWHAARATSAAPLFFEQFERDDAVFVDGAIGANNPSFIALKEVGQMHKCSPALLVNIGTGEKQASDQTGTRKRDRVGEIIMIDQPGSRRQFFKKWFEVGNMAKNLLTNTTAMWENTVYLASYMKVQCYRFEVPNHVGEYILGAIPIDEWVPPSTGEVTLDKIRAATAAYIEDNDVQTELEKYAKELVAIRRRRARTERWEQFANAIAYHCTCDARCRELPGNMNRKQLSDHINESHPERATSERDLVQALNSMRVPSWEKGPPTRTNTATVRAQGGGRLTRLFTWTTPAPGRTDSGRSLSGVAARTA